MNAVVSNIPGHPTFEFESTIIIHRKSNGKIGKVRSGRHIAAQLLSRILYVNTKLQWY